MSAGALLPQAPRGNAFEEAVARLVQLLKLGLVPAGGRLPPERVLALEWGLSRSTVRDAIASLRTAGYLTTRRGRGGGTFVVRPPVADPQPRRPAPAEVDDVLAHRLVLERGVVDLVAGRPLAAADADHLRRLAGECHAAGAAGYRAADSRLHLAIARLTGSASLLAAAAAVRSRVNDMLDLIPLIPSNLANSDEQHSALVEALADGDAAAARAVTDDHLAASAALLRGFLC